MVKSRVQYKLIDVVAVAVAVGDGPVVISILAFKLGLRGLQFSARAFRLGRS
jgi:hypothetical protein